TLTDSHSFSYTDTVPPELYTLSLHDALPICPVPASAKEPCAGAENRPQGRTHRCVEALSAERTGLAVTTTGASSGRVLRPSGSRSEERRVGKEGGGRRCAARHSAHRRGGEPV